jgi:hypothetical protein
MPDTPDTPDAPEPDAPEAPEPDEPDAPEPYSAPTEDEWKRVQATLRKRRDERDQARRELAAARRGKPGSDKPDEPDDKPNGPDPEAERWRAVAARNAATSAIQGAGFTGTAVQAKRLTALMDLSIEPDDDGSFDFEDGIDDLKDQYPEFFAARSSRPAPRVRTGGGRDDKEVAPDGDKAFAAKLMKQAGFSTRSLS